jgi:hypothetical protein
MKRYVPPFSSAGGPHASVIELEAVMDSRTSLAAYKYQHRRSMKEPPHTPLVYLLLVVCERCDVVVFSPAGNFHYYRICLCSRPFVPAAFVSGTICGFYPGSNG